MFCNGHEGRSIDAWAPTCFRRDAVGDDVPDTYNWLLDIPFWEETPLGHESKMFALDDFLARSNRPGDLAWYAHFSRWCRVRHADTLEHYDARSLGPVHGVEMLVVTRHRPFRRMGSAQTVN